MLVKSVSGCRIGCEMCNFPLSPPLGRGPNFRTWRRPQWRFIASGIKNLISFASETKMSVSAPIPHILKSVFSLKAKRLHRGYRVGTPDRQRIARPLRWRRADADLLKSGNCRRVQRMMTQYCAFGSRDQTNGTGRPLKPCLVRCSSRRCEPLMPNSGDSMSAGALP
jgi:hypothetical protein